MYKRGSLRPAGAFCVFAQRASAARAFSSASRAQLLLLRHGQSTYNRDKRFTGWDDPPLSAAGVEEAQLAGALLAERGLAPDLVFTSVLRRALKTAWLALEAMQREWVPLRSDWRLNERHYGALQGLSKADTAAQYGTAQVKEWRRSFDTVPPAGRPPADERYAALGVPAHALPRAESLKDAAARVGAVWRDTIEPALREGKRPLVVGHGNVLRAIVMKLDGISEGAISELNIPTGVPLVYELELRGEEAKAVDSYYLGDAEVVAAAAAAVAQQARVVEAWGQVGAKAVR
jgi:2,3-bisphosphoglycerate-dependent phosphoglycerate mutase